MVIVGSRVSSTSIASGSPVRVATPMPERTEYRVVGENFRGEPFETATPFKRQIHAEANLQTWKRGGALSGRIQSREVTETPWVDLPEGKQGVDRG